MEEIMRVRDLMTHPAHTGGMDANLSMSRRKTWIVIADGEHARVVTPAPKGAFHTLRTLESPTAHLSSAEMGSDRPATTIESATGTRHAITPRHDLHEMGKLKFARDVAGEINRSSAEGTFEKVLLVAPAYALKEILGELDPAATAKVLGTLRKDLIKVPDHELAPHLEEWFPETRAGEGSESWRR
jgi:protein required for attachment to host cells